MNPNPHKSKTMATIYEIYTVANNSIAANTNANTAENDLNIEAINL